MSVAQAMEAVDAFEFAEWMAFYEIDPWGEDRVERAVVLKKLYKPPTPRPTFHEVSIVFAAMSKGPP